MKNSISANSGQLNLELLIFVFSLLEMIKALYLWGKKGKPISDLPKTHMQLPQKRIKAGVLKQFPQIRSQAWQAIRPDFLDEKELHKWFV